jgi:citrate synthase
MSSLPEKQTTSIATSTVDDVFVRDRSLCHELIGKLTFTEMIYFQVLGVRPTAAQTAIVDACLVTLMEHGLTPSALATRLVYSSAEEAMQAAVAAGLLAVGSRFVGTTEGAGLLIDRVRHAGDDAEAEARRIALAHKTEKKPLPGFGHPFHKPDDPRTPVLFALAREHGIAGPHVEAALRLSAAVDATFQKHITLNVTGAIAALLGDAGVPREILRGFSLIARAAGLVGHVHEEQKKPAMRAIWEASEAAVPYDGTLPESSKVGEQS